MRNTILQELHAEYEQRQQQNQREAQGNQREGQQIQVIGQNAQHGKPCRKRRRFFQIAKRRRDRFRIIRAPGLQRQNRRRCRTVSSKTCRRWYHLIYKNSFLMQNAE